MNPNTVFSIVKKEFRQILRDRRMRGALFLSPVIMLVVFGYAVSTDVKSVSVAFNDMSRTPESREFIEKITSSKYFINERYVESPDSGEDALNGGSVEVYVEIPPSFARDCRGKSGASVLACIDGTDPNRASIIVSYLKQIVSGYSGVNLSAQVSASPALEQRVFFNEDLESRNFFLPCLLAMLIGLVTIMLTSMSIVKEREEGTMDQISVSPVTAFEFILGKVVPYTVIALVDMCVIAAVIILWFNVPFRGNIVFLLSSGLVFTLCNISVGIYISSVSATQQQAMLSTFLFFLPSIMLSGFMFPVDSMPSSIQMITYINPMRYFVDIVRSVFLKGGTFSILYPKIAALSVIAVILFITSSMKIRRGME